jgi:hypothetical protein
MIEAIRELLNADPFHPFKIVLTSGEVFEVANPELVAVGESVVVVCWPKSDRISILRMNQIASVDVPQAA